MQKMTPAILTGTVFGLLQSFGLGTGENHWRHFLHRFNVIYNSFGANLMLHTHSMYIYLLWSAAIAILHLSCFILWTLITF